LAHGFNPVDSAKVGNQGMLKTSAFLAFVVPMIASASADQNAITIDDALRMAIHRNGDVRSAFFTADAAGQQTKQAFAAFLPTVTPEYQYVSNRQQFPVSNFVGAYGLPINGTIFEQTEGGTTTATASWLLLDSGDREFTFLAARRSEDSSTLSAVQTLRQTLFQVYSDYVDAMKADETYKVDLAEVQRANTILDQTQTRVQAGDVAGKEVLQARADALNAQVTALNDEQARDTTLATLKGVIGWNLSDPFPGLAPLPDPPTNPPADLDVLVKAAVGDRPDLKSARLNIESLRYQKLKLERDAGISANLSAGWTETLTPQTLQNRTFTFTVTTPLFDGGLSRAEARQARLNMQAAQATYDQQERSAKADIESARAQLVVDLQRVGAARLALQAAQLNYNAAEDSQRLGAGTLIDVLTARVSLATAENNAISAKYDALLATVNLSLVTGKPIPGGGGA
jgi:outer membrane protein